MAGLVQGKIALVTGGSSGIGRATALIFAREGAKVVVADVAVEGGEETVRLVNAAGGAAIFVKTDVSKSADGEAMVKKAVASDEVRDDRANLPSPPGRPRRVLHCGVAVAREAARAPSAGLQKRGGGQARAGPAAAERSTPRLRSALAPGPRRLPGAAPAVRRLPGPGPRGAGDGGRPCRAASWRPEAVLGRAQLGAGLQALP